MLFTLNSRKLRIRPLKKYAETFFPLPWAGLKNGSYCRGAHFKYHHLSFLFLKNSAEKYTMCSFVTLFVADFHLLGEATGEPMGGAGALSFQAICPLKMAIPSCFCPGDQRYRYLPRSSAQSDLT